MRTKLLASSGQSAQYNTLKSILLSVTYSLLFMILSFSVKAQQWVSFGNSTTPKAPEITLISATNQQVVFTCESFGFYQTDVVNGGITYQNINMPGVSNLKQPGYPNLPIVNRAIAYSGKISPSVTVNILQQLTYKEYTVYPAPALHDSVTSNNFPWLAEVFTINNHVYTQNSQYPLDICAIVSSGQFRDQKFINVVTNPLQWNPINKKLIANVKCTVTVNLGNSDEETLKNTGIFENIASEIFLNYSKNNKPENTNKTNKATSSYVQYYTLTQPSDADNIVADYLIITDQQFFEPNNPNSELRRIAAHRANYNGYVVAVISAQNIMSDAVGFPYTYFPQFGDDDSHYKNERRIRECIERIYNNGHAPHTYDGHLAYVLLVGDAVRDDSGTTPTIGVPGSHDPYDIVYFGQTGDPTTTRTPSTFVTDYYYSLLTTRPEPGFTVKDDIGDLYVGRFSVKDPTQLYNIVEKTIHYETDYDFAGWKNKSFFFNSKSIDPEHNYLAGNNRYYNYFIPNRIGTPYSFEIKDMYDYNYADEIPTVMACFNSGQGYSSYYGHSKYWCIQIGAPIGQPNAQYLTTEYLELNLDNVGKYGFMYMLTCDAGMYDLANGAECLAEELTRYSDTKGFVGILAASTPVILEQNNDDPIVTPATSQEFLLDENYMQLAHCLGESILISKVKKQNCNPVATDITSMIYNLIGDPGLNLRSQGYSVSKNTTLDHEVTISEPVHVLSGVTLTLPNNCNLFFGNNGRLIIDQGAFISFDDNAYFHGMVMTNALEIRGGIKTKTGSLPNISFEAPDGMSCSGLVFENAELDAAFKKLTFTRSAIFANNLNSLTVVSPSYNRSSFNLAPLFIKSKSIVLEYCNFVNSSSLFCYRNNSDGLDAYIRNCTFTPSATQPTNQSDMIYIGGYQNFDLQNNSITFNSGDGISLYNSGTGTIKNIKNNLISFSGSTYYQNNGIKLYNSNAEITTNSITNAKYGISTFSNTIRNVSLNGYDKANAPSNTQQIYNNTEYQVFSADAGSFPSPFKYNYIENFSTKPLVYCAGSSIPMGSLNVRCNNWGSSFVPSQDLYPVTAYTYLPIWAFSGVCSGKSLAQNNNSNPLEIISGFKSRLRNDGSDSPENIASLSRVSGYLISSKSGINLLNELLAELIEEHNQDLLGKSARNIRNQLNVSRGEYGSSIREAEQRLASPVSLADSVYASIELAQVLLQAGNGRLADSQITSLYQDLIPSDYDAFYSYKAKLVSC